MRALTGQHRFQPIYWLMAFCLLLPVLTVGVPAFAFSTVPITSTTPAGITDNFQGNTLSPLVAVDGNWSVANGSLAVDNVTSTAPLDKQFAYEPTNMTNETILSQFSISNTDASGKWRVGVFVHGTGTANPQKWALILRDGEVSLLDENTSWVSQAKFSMTMGQTYDMELQVDGTTVKGKVWASGQSEPSAWTVTGNFPPNAAETGTAAGIYVAGADAAFTSFQVGVDPPALAVTPNQAGGVFVSGTQPGYQATLTNSSGQGADYNVVSTVYNIEGQPVDTQTAPVSVPPNGATTVSIPISLPALGYYTMSTALMDSGGIPVETLPTQSLAEIADPPSSSGSSASTDSLVGMNGNLALDKSPGASSEFNQEFQLLENQGVGWYRLNLNASELFPSAQGAQWDTSDALVEAARSHGINILGLLTGWPEGLNPFSANASVSFTTALNNYVAYVQQVVERYRPGGTLAAEKGWQNYGISSWEIWNEPVTSSFWGGTAAQYAALAEAAATAIRAIEPNATILAYDDHASNLETQGANLYSGLSLHYYPGTKPPTNTSFSIASSVTQGLSMAKSIGGSLWVTEAGWSTTQVSPVAQAQDWVNTVLEGLGAGASRIFLFSQIYLGSGYGEENNNLTPKVSYPALAALDDRLAGYQPEGRLQMGPSVIAEAFSSPSGTTVALTSAKGAGNLALPASVTTVSAYDWMNDPINQTGSQLVVPLSASPVYLVFPGYKSYQVQAILNASTETDLVPVSLALQSQPGYGSLSPEVVVGVTNISNQAVNGKVTLTLPSGWTAATSGTADPQVRVGPVPVNGTADVIFHLRGASVDDSLPVTATMTIAGASPVVVTETLGKLLGDG